MPDYSRCRYRLLTFLGVAVIALLILDAASVASREDERLHGNLDSFAQCLTESGAKFYGAFWCPHCKDHMLRLKLNDPQTGKDSKII